MNIMAHVARVKNGRLVLDEPTDLPDGTTIELYDASDLPEDELGDEELARLDEAVERSHADIKAGRTVSPENLIRKLRSAR
jgi:hypothetical protein